MLKRNFAVLLVAGLVLGGGAFAWAQGSPSQAQGAPAALATVAAGVRDPAARRAGGEGKHALYKRAVHGDLIVRGRGGAFENYTFDRGKVDAASSTSITLTRPDGKQVTVSITPDTKFRGVRDASGLQTGKPAVVVSQGGKADLVDQRA